MNDSKSLTVGQMVGLVLIFVGMLLLAWGVAEALTDTYVSPISMALKTAGNALAFSLGLIVYRQFSLNPKQENKHD